jgi:hypothetical protein
MLNRPIEVISALNVDDEFGNIGRDRIGRTRLRYRTEL